jgi:hypothetical protein
VNSTKRVRTAPSGPAGASGVDTNSVSMPVPATVHSETPERASEVMASVPDASPSTAGAKVTKTLVLPPACSVKACTSTAKAAGTAMAVTSMGPVPSLETRSVFVADFVSCTFPKASVEPVKSPDNLRMRVLVMESECAAVQADSSRVSPERACARTEKVPVVPQAWDCEEAAAHAEVEASPQSKRYSSVPS